MAWILFTIAGGTAFAAGAIASVWEKPSKPVTKDSRQAIVAASYIDELWNI